MELVNIEKLLEKYFEATTTVAEEQQLQQYFAQGEVAPHLEEYQAMFTYFSGAKQEQFTKLVPLKTKRSYAKWVSIAAVFVLAFGIYTQVQPKDEFSQQEIENAQKVLAMLSNNFNKGATQVGYLDTFAEGASQIGLIGEFEQQTNRFLHKKNN